VALPPLRQKVSSTQQMKDTVYTIYYILKIKVQVSLIFKSSQSESIKFSRDQSESTTQIRVALMGVDTNFHRPYYSIKPVFHSRISPPLAKNFATEKVHLLFFRAVNESSNRS
jgi:hypothetical protein